MPFPLFYATSVTGLAVGPACSGVSRTTAPNMNAPVFVPSGTYTNKKQDGKVNIGAFARSRMHCHTNTLTHSLSQSQSGTRPNV